MSESELVAEIKRQRVRIDKLESQEGESTTMVKKLEAQIATLEARIEAQAGAGIDWDA